MSQSTEIRKLKQEIQRLEQELVISQTVVRMQGDKRPIEAALKAGIKPEDLPQINFLHCAKDPDKLIVKKDSLQEQIGNTHFSFQPTKTKNLYLDCYQPFLS